MQDPTVVRELAGALGVPGAIMSLVISFYFGARAVLLLQHKRNGTEGGGGGGVTYKDAATMTDLVRHDVDVAERSVMDNVNRTRHELNSGLAKVLASLQEANEKQTDRLVGKLDHIAVLIEAGNDRRT